jgi:hypothetical protein
MKKLLSCIILLAVFLYVGDAQALTVRIDKARFVESMAPGDVARGRIRVENPTEDPATIRVYSEDWAYKEQGTGDKDYYPPGTLKNSAAPWIRFNPTDFVLQPYGSGYVNYTLQVPDDVTGEGEYRCMLFFETTIGTMTNEQGTTVQVAGRLGSLVYVQLKGKIRRTGLIKGFEIKPPVENSPAEFKVTFENTGNLVIALDGQFVILDSTGLAKGRGEMTPIYTHGGMTATRTTEWTGRLEPGAYDVLVTFELGDGEILIHEEKMLVR